jgi:hypothetical protein
MMELDFLNILFHVLNIMTMIGAALGIFLSVRWLIRFRRRGQRVAQACLPRMREVDGEAGRRE